MRTLLSRNRITQVHSTDLDLDSVTSLSLLVWEYDVRCCMLLYGQTLAQSHWQHLNDNSASNFTLSLAFGFVHSDDSEPISSCQQFRPWVGRTPSHGYSPGPSLLKPDTKEAMLPLQSREIGLGVCCRPLVRTRSLKPLGATN